MKVFARIIVVVACAIPCIGTAVAGPLPGSSVAGSLAVIGNRGGVVFSGTATVGNGVEFSYGPDPIFAVVEAADFGDGTLTLSRFTGGTSGIYGVFEWTFTLAPGLVFDAISERTDNNPNGDGFSLFSSSTSTATFRIAGGDGTPFTTYSATYALDIGTRAVPEPASSALLAMGIAGLAIAQRRRRRTCRAS